MFLDGNGKPLYSLSGGEQIREEIALGRNCDRSVAGADVIRPARADTALDMATFTCQDWLDASDDERDLMLVWLRGYLGGRAGTSLYYPDATRTDRTKMEIYCRAHLAIGVISAMGLLLH